MICTDCQMPFKGEHVSGRCNYCHLKATFVPRVITITETFNSWEVREGDRYHDRLCRDEVFVQIASMLLCKDNGTYYGLMTKEEWEEENKRLAAQVYTSDDDIIMTGEGHGHDELEPEPDPRLVEEVQKRTLSCGFCKGTGADEESITSRLCPHCQGYGFIKPEVTGFVEPK